MIISTDELKELIDSKRDFVLVDVRNDNELVNGMIPSAAHLCLQDFGFAWDLSEVEYKERFGFDKPNKEKLIICYCRTGSRSGVAADFLREKGYNAKNYEGSVQAWSQIDDNVKMYFG